MKVGVIADIHSNQTAFRACVDYMVNAGCEEFLLLGDFISDTAGARQTMELLYELMEQFPCHVLRGNREEYMIEQRKIREKEEEEKFWPANSASGKISAFSMACTVGKQKIRVTAGADVRDCDLFF